MFHSAANLVPLCNFTCLAPIMLENAPLTNCDKQSGLLCVALCIFPLCVCVWPSGGVLEYLGFRLNAFLYRDFNNWDQKEYGKSKGAMSGFDIRVQVWSSIDLLLLLWVLVLFPETIWNQS